MRRWRNGRTYMPMTSWRQRARDGFNWRWSKRWPKTYVAETTTHADLIGRSLTSLADERGTTPFDVVCDLSLAEQLQTRFLVVLANDDEPALGELSRDNRTLLGLSDAGAHADQLCDACYTTHLLEHWVRQKQALSLEKAVWRMTGHPAQVFRFLDRGIVAPGFVADLVAFDEDRIGVEPLQRVWDLPMKGESRLVAGSRGIQGVWMSGELTRWDEQEIVGEGRGQIISDRRAVREPSRRPADTRIGSRWPYFEGR